MTSIAEIPFGEWLPSAPTHRNPGCVVANNVIPTPGGYGPFRSFSGLNDTATEAVQGAVQTYDDTRSSVVVGGSSTRLFVRRSSIAETSGYSAIGAGEAWDFARFNAFMVATGGANAPQYLSDIDSDNTWSGLPGSPPTAKRCARIGDFLVLGNLSTDPAGIAWSAFNSPATSWAPSRLTQAGSAALDPDRGQVQRVVGLGRSGLVFQERSVSRMTYVGPPTVWRLDEVARDRGAVAPFSVVTLGFLTYFLDKDGFFVTNGAEFAPIGSSRVNRWFFDNVAQADIARTQAAVDFQNECIVWNFVGKGAATFSRQIIYSWAQERWSSAETPVEWFLSSAADATFLDALESTYANLDDVPHDIDSPVFQAGDTRLAGFVDKEYGLFVGLPLRARFEIGEAQPAPGHWVFVSEVRPLFVADEWRFSAAVKGYRNKGALRSTGLKQMGRNGFVPVRAEGEKLWIRCGMDANSEWKDAQGVQVTYRKAGKR